MTMSLQNKRSPRRQILRVEHPKAIKFLTNINELRCLNPFMRHERTLSSVAHELNMSLSLLLRKVKRMIEFGLLEVRTAKQPHGGRSLKHYVSSANEFFLPENSNAEELVLTQSEAKMNAQFERALLNMWFNREHQTQNDWGLRVACLGDSLGIFPASHPGVVWDTTSSNTPALLIRKVVRLSKNDAAWMCAELERLDQELQRRHRDHGQTYLTRLCLIPEQS
jgi:predicted transcriptional regulator